VETDKDDRLYKIQPLEWTKHNAYPGVTEYRARPAIGEYTVYVRWANEQYSFSVSWILCDSEFYAGNADARSLEEGKQIAWDHWSKFLANCLVEVNNVDMLRHRKQNDNYDRV